MFFYRYIYIYIYTKYIHLNICSFIVDTHFKSSNVHHCCTTSRAKTSVKRIPNTDHPNLFRNYHKLPKLSQIFVLLEGVSQAQVVSSMPVPSHSYSSPPSKAMTEKNFPKPNPLHTQFKKVSPQNQKDKLEFRRKWLAKNRLQESLRASRELREHMKADEVVGATGSAGSADPDPPMPDLDPIRNLDRPDAWTSDEEEETESEGERHERLRLDFRPYRICPTAGVS